MPARHLLLAAVLMVPGMALAQTPPRAIQIIVPFAPGASADGIGRLVASGMAERLNRQIVVGVPQENRVSVFRGAAATSYACSPMCQMAGAEPGGGSAAPAAASTAATIAPPDAGSPTVTASPTVP